jgi:hypothetical protein
MEKAIKYMPSSSSFTTDLSLKPPIAINHNTTGDRATSGAAAGAHHIGVEGPPKWHKGQEVADHLSPARRKKLAHTYGQRPGRE